MTRPRSVFCIIAFAAAAIVTAAPREVRCPQDYLERAAMNELVAATTIEQLDQRWKALPAPDGVAKLMYAMRRSELAPGARSDQLLIQAIPADSVTFDLAYSLCYPKYDDVSDAVAAIAAGSWLDPALSAVMKQHDGYSRLLMLPFIAKHNADIGEVILCLIAELKERAPKEFAHAYSALPAQAREYVCAECC